jgi:hypothetical protein
MTEYWDEIVKGESFVVSKGENEPFRGDDGGPYEIHIQLYEDGSISTAIHDLGADTFESVRLRDYAREAAMRWKALASLSDEALEERGWRRHQIRKLRENVANLED